MPFNPFLELIVILKVAVKVAESLILFVFSVSSSKDSEGDLFCKPENEAAAPNIC